MQLSKKIIGRDVADGMEWPSPGEFLLPEKVLQFGTGVLLRGLPDYFIDKANKQKIFNGRIVVVKSTETRGADEFARQDGLYTLCVRGIESSRTVEENIVNASISRVLSAKNEWEEILKCAANPLMEIVISNTTEVGLVLANDNIFSAPPSSFPGKLLAFLYKRYEIFNGDIKKGMVIIPTELIPNNADKLFSILMELSKQNKLEEGFIDWMKSANHFCNSLVDRIVPGKLSTPEQNKMEEKCGYHDELMIMSEAYRLWAIECSNENVKEILSFSKADSGIVIAPDITVFRELKLRLLNGSHTFSCGLAHLAGFATVKQAMNDRPFSDYIKGLMLDEIAPAIEDEKISLEQAQEFGLKVLDRFRNPFIEHQWLSITLQYSSKMNMRNVPSLLKYIQHYKKTPGRMAFGFAAYLLFMKAVEKLDNKYYGEANGKKYLINDEWAAYYYEIWKLNDVGDVVNAVLSDQKLWQRDLLLLDGFADEVKKYLNLLIKKGAKEMLSAFPAR
ncbi:MAG: tagaturonate reductase [Bacteroidetes bacterium]|nr:tagaturonate reductase [Bacteroidota bacterium]MBS1972731.1 tagaturonate reductase [Bacteroidota bacterium]